MPAYFFDSSVVVKRYYVEAGSGCVDQILDTSGASHFVSRLTEIEVQRALAGKVRTKEISVADFEKVCRLFRNDLAGYRFRMMHMADVHYRSAVRLVHTYGPNLKRRLLHTLDALQLAVALDIHQLHGLDGFVCADHALCEAAQNEGLTVVNPVLPE